MYQSINVPIVSIIPENILWQFDVSQVMRRIFLYIECGCCLLFTDCCYSSLLKLALNLWLWYILGFVPPTVVISCHHIFCVRLFFYIYELRPFHSRLLPQPTRLCTILLYQIIKLWEMNVDWYN